MKYHVKFEDEAISCLNSNCDESCVRQNNCMLLSSKTLIDAQRYDILTEVISNNDIPQIQSLIKNIEKEVSHDNSRRD